MVAPRAFATALATAAALTLAAAPAQGQPAIVATSNGALQMSASDVLLATPGGTPQSLTGAISRAVAASNQAQANSNAISTNTASIASTAQARAQLSSQIDARLTPVSAAAAAASTGLGQVSTRQAYMGTTVNTLSGAFGSLSTTQVAISTAMNSNSGLAQVSTAVSQLVAMVGPPRTTATNRPQGCKDLNLTVAQAGMFTVWPAGPSQASQQVYCAALVDPSSGVAPTSADWTVIISDVESSYSTDIPTLYNTVPTPTTSGALQRYLTQDLRSWASELYVINEAAQSHVFNLSAFSGPVTFAGPNWCGNDGHLGHGFVAGNRHPVAYHFQVGLVCSAHASDPNNCYVTDQCRNLPCSNRQGAMCCYDTGTYSSPILILADWDFMDNRANPNLHASFGASNRTRQLWSYKGTLMAVR